MKKYIVLFGIILTATLIGGCNFPGFKWNSPTPNVTQAYQTIQAQIATLGQVMGTATIQPFTATITPPTTIQITTSSSIQVLPSATRQPTQICDRASPGNPIDVTIPDDSVVATGAEFTKTWRLVNDGACTWTRQYALIWFSGDQFTDTKIIYLRQDVAPGQSIDFSVDMTAPNKSGSYQSNWMLQNPSGVYFGIGPNGKSPFWVRISVESGSKPTNTPMGTGELYLYYSGVVILTEGR